MQMNEWFDDVNVDCLSRLPNGGLLEIAKVYPLDAVFDTPEDVPEDVRESHEYTERALIAFLIDMFVVFVNCRTWYLDALISCRFCEEPSLFTCCCPNPFAAYLVLLLSTFSST